MTPYMLGERAAEQRLTERLRGKIAPAPPCATRGGTTPASGASSVPDISKFELRCNNRSSSEIFKAAVALC